jgi:hypothetical protein
MQNDGFDVQVGTGMNKRFYRVFVLFTNFLGDSPQLHSLTGVCQNACHLCMRRNFANFRIEGCDDNGDNISILAQERPRNIETQVQAGVAHLKVMADFIKKVEGSNNREGQQKRVTKIQF